MWRSADIVRLLSVLGATSAEQGTAVELGFNGNKLADSLRSISRAGGKAPCAEDPTVSPELRKDCEFLLGLDCFEDLATLWTEVTMKGLSPVFVMERLSKDLGASATIKGTTNNSNSRNDNNIRATSETSTINRTSSGGKEMASVKPLSTPVDVVDNSEVLRLRLEIDELKRSIQVQEALSRETNAFTSQLQGVATQCRAELERSGIELKSLREELMSQRAVNQAQARAAEESSAREALLKKELAESKQAAADALKVLESYDKKIAKLSNEITALPLAYKYSTSSEAAESSGWIDVRSGNQLKEIKVLRSASTSFDIAALLQSLSNSVSSLYESNVFRNEYKNMNSNSKAQFWSDFLKNVPESINRLYEEENSGSKDIGVLKSRVLADSAAWTVAQRCHFYCIYNYCKSFRDLDKELTMAKSRQSRAVSPSKGAKIPEDENSLAYLIQMSRLLVSRSNQIQKALSTLISIPAEPNDRENELLVNLLKSLSDYSKDSDSVYFSNIDIVQVHDDSELQNQILRLKEENSKLMTALSRQSDIFSQKIESLNSSWTNRIQEQESKLLRLDSSIKHVQSKVLAQQRPAVDESLRVPVKIDVKSAVNINSDTNLVTKNETIAPRNLAKAEITVQREKNTAVAPAMATAPKLSNIDDLLSFESHQGEDTLLYKNLRPGEKPDVRMEEFPDNRNNPHLLRYRDNFNYSSVESDMDNLMKLAPQMGYYEEDPMSAVGAKWFEVNDSNAAHANIQSQEYQGHEMFDVNERINPRENVNVKELIKAKSDFVEEIKTKYREFASSNPKFVHSRHYKYDLTINVPKDEEKTEKNSDVITMSSGANKASRPKSANITYTYVNKAVDHPAPSKSSGYLQRNEPIIVNTRDDLAPPGMSPSPRSTSSRPTSAKRFTKNSFRTNRIVKPSVNRAQVEVKKSQLPEDEIDVYQMDFRIDNIEPPKHNSTVPSKSPSAARHFELPAFYRKNRKYTFKDVIYKDEDKIAQSQKDKYIKDLIEKYASSEPLLNESVNPNYNFENYSITNSHDETNGPVDVLELFFPVAHGNMGTQIKSSNNAFTTVYDAPQDGLLEFGA